MQYYLDCLSQASHLVGYEGTRRAVVVDPRRDVDVYLDDGYEAWKVHHQAGREKERKA